MEPVKEYILITGASSGIGKNLAIKLSESNNIILNGRNEERLEETRKSCSKNREHLVFRFDLENTSGLEDAFSDFILKNRIGVKYFVHCAGLLKMLPIKMFTPALISSVFSVNVFSAALITKILINRKYNIALKSIVFISSNISNFGAKAFTIYGSSKGALDSLMRSLAVELAPGIRVNSVLPGAIKTEMTGNILENTGVADRMISLYPLGIGMPDDIYEVVTFLLSEKSRWITGQQFTVDGGRTINITG